MYLISKYQVILPYDFFRNVRLRALPIGAPFQRFVDLGKKHLRMKKAKVYIYIHTISRNLIALSLRRTSSSYGPVSGRFVPFKLYYTFYLKRFIGHLLSKSIDSF